jgi:hypothetical protein
MEYIPTNIKNKTREFNSQGIFSEENDTPDNKDISLDFYELCNHAAARESTTTKAASNIPRTTTTQAKATMAVQQAQELEALKQAAIAAAVIELERREAAAAQARAAADAAAAASAEAQRVGGEQPNAQAAQAAADAQAAAVVMASRADYADSHLNGAKASTSIMLDHIDDVIDKALTGEPAPMADEMVDTIIMETQNKSIPLTEAEDKIIDLVVEKINEKAEVGERNKVNTIPVIVKKLGFLDQIVEYVYNAIYAKKKV